MFIIVLKENIIASKYTFEDVKSAFIEKGYELISTNADYKNCSTRLEYVCKRHRDYGIQRINYSSIIAGHGCIVCGRENGAKKTTKTIDYDADRKLTEENGLEYVTTVKVKNRYHIQYICPTHRDKGIQIKTKTGMERGNGCPYCAGNHKLTAEEKMERIRKNNPNIILIDPLPDRVLDRVKCRCLIHNTEMNSLVKGLIEGQVCKKCSHEYQRIFDELRPDEINNAVHIKNPHVQLIEYKNTKTKAKWLCTKHNEVFERYISTLTRSNSGCHLCYKENMIDRFSVPLDEFNNRLAEKHPCVTLIRGYSGIKRKADFYCEEHDCYFSISPEGILSRNTCCDKANPTFKEEQMCLLIESWGYKITRQKVFQECKDKSYLPFDCYLNDFNTIVEFDGEQHYYPISYNGIGYADAVEKYKYTVNHDSIKNKFCKDNKINIIRVPYFEFDDLEGFLFDQFVKHRIIIEK